MPTKKPKPIVSAPDLGKEHLRFGRMAQHLIEIMPLGVLAFDNNFNITDCNPFACRMLAKEGNIADALVKACGQPPQKSWQDQLRQVLESGKPSTFENVTCSYDGSNHILHIICTAMSVEKSEKPLGGLLLIDDVTAKLMMEKELAMAERLASVGKLAARVAHELNNPLDGILRYINLAMRVCEEHGQAQISHYLLESRKGLRRMVKIVSELLEFSRNTYSAVEEADINKIVEDAVKAMESKAQENKVNIIRQYSRETPNIRSGNLFQVFCNLIKNAVDAMPQGGDLEIVTHCDNDNLVIEFADSGTGLSQEVQEKLFEPFFSTKESGKGTGLGLPICKDIIERYNGRIRAENRPQGGSLFTVSIPLAMTGWNGKKAMAMNN